MNIIIQCPLETMVYQAEWMECNTSVGNFVIQEGHAPMMLALSAGQPLKILLEDKTLKSFSITTTGFVEITPHKITVLLPSLIQTS